MEEFNFSSKEFISWTINNIISSNTSLKDNIFASYPNKELSYPLAIASGKDENYRYDFSGNPLYLKVYIDLEMWSNMQTEVQDIQKELEKVMYLLGFTRQSPTKPILDTTNNKLKITQTFTILYNLLDKKLERKVS